MTPEQKEEKKKQAAIAELKRKDQLADIKAVMSIKAGRRFVWRLLEDGNIFRPCMTGNSNTFYLLGKRDFMIPHYQDVMEACPELFAKAQAENFKPDEGVKS